MCASGSPAWPPSRASACSLPTTTTPLQSPVPSLLQPDACDHLQDPRVDHVAHLLRSGERQRVEGAGFRTDTDVIRPWGRPAARMDGSRAAAAAAAPGGGGRPWDDAHGDGERAEEEEGLRAWLDRPGRAVEATECLHVFRQVAEAVSVAHAQGVAVGSARPSCFVVSPPFARVAFIESASGSDASGSDASEEDGADHDAADAQPPRRPNSNGAAQARDGQHKGFPLKSVLAMELNWYTSPEEADDGPAGATFASNIYRLGVLLFELFCSFETLEEKMRAMANLRYRVLPPQLLGLAKQAVLRSGYLVMEIIISDEKVDIMTEDFDRFSSIIRRVESLRKLGNSFKINKS